jgi:hypothetical protein
MKWWVGNQEDSLGSLMGVGMKLVFSLPLPLSTLPLFVGEKANDTLESPTIFEGVHESINFTPLPMSIIFLSPIHLFIFFFPFPF